MNSLTDLNGFVSSFTLPFTDQRLANVLFDRSAPTNQTQSVDRGFTINASIGMDITEILNPIESVPVYTINVSNLASATVSWASLPAGVTVTNTTPGIYVVQGFQDKSSWDAIKSPTIDFSDDYYGSWTYTSTISYTSFSEGAQTKTWTTGVTVNNILFLSNPSQFIYSLSAVSNISGEPLLGNLDAAYPGVTWTVTVTPSSTTSINTFTTTGSGGTFSVNASTKIITISGTRAQVNSRLAGLQIDANATAVDFVLTYFASNSLNGVTDTKSQTLVSQGLAVLGAVTNPTIYFIEDSNFTITGAPVITDVGFDGSGTYIYTITPSTTSAIDTATIGGSGGSASFNASTKVITISGTRSEINGRLGNINIVTATDWGTTFNLLYNCTTPRADIANKIQVVEVGSNDTEVTNMNISRSYLSQNVNVLFPSSIPFISDLDATNPTYTVTFSSPNGEFNLAASASPYVEGPQPTSSLSITGTKTEINNKFSLIRFYPTPGFSGNTTFTYTQIKNGVTQVSQSVALIGSASTYVGRDVDFINSQTWTPNFSDVKYGKIDSILLVGGGGGGSAGGGGGGEVIYSATDIPLTNTTYTIQIGAGGLAGISNPTLDGGAAGGNGGSTIAFGLTARGGGGGSPVFNSSPFTGAQGGYSWDANGNQVNGGTGLGFTRTSSPTGTWYVGGGGAGSSGFTYGIFATSGNRINANNTQNPPYGTPGVGALGRQTAEFANPYQYENNNLYPITYSYGFGGGGGGYSTNQIVNRGQNGGYLDGYTIPSGLPEFSPSIGTYGAGAFIQYYGNTNRGTLVAIDRGQATSPNRFINGVRDPNVAGGGGGAGVIGLNGLAPPTNGGDGVVRLKIR